MHKSLVFVLKIIVFVSNKIYLNISIKLFILKKLRQIIKSSSILFNLFILLDFNSILS